ncbi:S41 family peptidase [Candidatus Wolfebacteria bacterium]|nr:S41 family peptidase [Candidatus Wolfebacteria bacterium]
MKKNFKFLKSKDFTISILIIVIFVISGGAFYFGYEQGIKNPKTILIHGVSNLEEGKNEAIDFSLFWDAWQVIKDKYVKGGETNNQDLVYGAISGLINSLGDENSVFFTPGDAKKFNEDISGQFSGIGAQIDIKEGQLSIVAPLKNTPADKAGLRSGDKILKVDDTNTLGLTVEEAVKIIRGERGSVVILTIFRENWDKEREISIIRDIIQVPTIDWEIMEDNIAYIHLYNFYEQAPYLFYQTAMDIILQNPKGLILDLRDNPGGYLGVSINLAGWFFQSGTPVVNEEFRSGNNNLFKSSGTGLFRNIPMVVLVNKGSASASEILAGALQDNRKIELIGTKTFGKGTVQELTPLKDGSVVKITTAHWRLPKGELIDKEGLTPDYEINLTDEDIKEGKDPQLEKAIEVLKEKMGNWDFLKDFIENIDIDIEYEPISG